MLLGMLLAMELDLQLVDMQQLVLLAIGQDLRLDQ